MARASGPPDVAAIPAFIDLAGAARWRKRMDALAGAVRSGRLAGRAVAQRHAIEFSLDRLRPGRNQPLSAAGRVLTILATDAVQLADSLTATGRQRLRQRLAEALRGQASLVPLFHLLRTARLQRSRGFLVHQAALADAAGFDLLLDRGGLEAELVCDVISAEEGREVHRGAWFRLVDRIDPELQNWLAAHPGRYILKMTLPQGLREEADGAGQLAALHARISALLQQQRRADHDEAAVLRLDPLLLVAAQADELGLVSRLRQEFGPEAHLAVSSAGGGVFVMAARAGRENEIAAAVRRRMAALAPTRLTGTRPGILAMFIDDTDRVEWRNLRDRLELEGEARQFLTFPEARSVVAVTCASRLELFGAPIPDAAPDGEMRFRNPAHPAAKAAALAPAVLSSF
ncbi:MAG TPA: hypothetical protein VME92_08160 [Acetobacteraceae bacterium]|nr:hypothetical protein [Acetobacteraceae bacterium]